MGFRAKIEEEIEIFVLFFPEAVLMNLNYFLYEFFYAILPNDILLRK
jgi:hypothetical protein